MLDKASELAKGDAKIGSTLKVIGPTYMDKTGRNGLRVGDLSFNGTLPSKQLIDKYVILTNKHFDILNQNDHFINWSTTEFSTKKYDSTEQFKSEETKWFESIEFLKSFDFIDSEYYINKALKERKTVLAEGAQGSLLDVDYGTYPFVTSSNTTVSGVCSGLGVPPHAIGNVTGIFKAYTTRVGSGPFSN